MDNMYEYTRQLQQQCHTPWKIIKMKVNTTIPENHNADFCVLAYIKCLCHELFIGNKKKIDIYLKKFKLNLN